MTDTERIRLINDVVYRFAKRIDALDQIPNATTLVYLVWAIADKSYITVGPEEQDDMHRFMRLYFPHNHAVWDFVEVEDPSIEEAQG